MNVETVARTIQLILAPVVMVTACSILLGSLQTRYSVINDRLRVMARERLDLLQPMAGTAPTFIEERLLQLDTQIPLLLKRHRLAHHAVLMVYCAIVVFIGDMFVIAIGAVVNIDLVASIVLILFLISTGLMLVGALFAVREVSTSQQALYYELQRVASLPRSIQK